MAWVLLSIAVSPETAHSWCKHCSRGKVLRIEALLSAFVLLQEFAATDAGLAVAEQAADAGAVERQQECKTLAGSLPEGLRTALGLSMGQPVGSLKPSTDKAHLDAALPVAPAPSTITVAPAAAPSMPAGARLELF